ncbi:MAG: c-type cytochrome [Novosphingobium sp.]|nr:c-type cytochrome [Novosphingobium sp.]
MALCACSGEPAADTASNDAAAPPETASQATSGPVATPEGAETPVTAETEGAQAPAASPPVAFNQCRSCHAVEPGRKGIGPDLHGIVGRKAAMAEGFNYSDALKNSGLTWDRETLDKWIESPMKLVPGTRMVVGIPNPEARKDIIDYLETLK